MPLINMFSCVYSCICISSHHADAIWLENYSETHPLACACSTENRRRLCIASCAYCIERATHSNHCILVHIGALPSSYCGLSRLTGLYPSTHNIYIYMYTYIFSYTHMYIYVMYVYIYICLYI